MKRKRVVKFYSETQVRDFFLEFIDLLETNNTLSLNEIRNLIITKFTNDKESVDDDRLSISN